MMESNSSLFNKPMLMVLIVAKYNRPHLGDFCEKPLLESANLCVKEKLYNRTIVDTYFDLLKSGYIYTFFWNAFSYFSLWILNSESRAK